MAKDKKNNKNNKKKDSSKSFWKRVKRFFSDIKAELKRVTWPDKKRLKSNSGIVIAIIILSILMIFIFDTAISSLFNVTGFYDYNNQSEQEMTQSQNTEDTADNTIQSTIAETTKSE